MKKITGLFRVFLVLFLITGIIYPVLIYILGQLFFPWQANGSILSLDGKKVGSALIARNFRSNKYFHSRPSATDYSIMPSAGSNLAASSETLTALFRKNQRSYLLNNPTVEENRIPSEMLFSSGSGVDPDISKESALQQIESIAKARDYSPLRKQKLMNIISGLSRKTIWGILGPDIVNVLKLNIETDKLDKE